MPNTTDPLADAVNATEAAHAHILARVYKAAGKRIGIDTIDVSRNRDVLTAWLAVLAARRLLCQDAGEVMGAEECDYLIADTAEELAAL